MRDPPAAERSQRPTFVHLTIPYTPPLTLPHPTPHLCAPDIPPLAASCARREADSWSAALVLDDGGADVRAMAAARAELR